MTHTYVVLQISKRAFEEIRKKLLEAGYQHAMHDDEEHGVLIDMHGLAIADQTHEPEK